MPEIIGLRFRREGKQYYFDPQGQTVPLGSGVIVETSWGVEYGTCVRTNSVVEESAITPPLRPILRLASPDDARIVEKNRQREQEAFRTCQRKIAEHGLEMKLVDVEVAFEGSKLLFFFTSEGRVDFRALVKDLAAIFHSRIELRQIGVRDEAKMIGGLGICGRPFCCSSFLREFQPVSIKMAKTQNLSLNPTKISGTCGRLMCCLKYEQDAYEDLLRSSPKSDSFVETPDGVGDIIGVNVLREKVRVRLDNAPDTVKVYHNSEIRVIRAGKGRRPEDYRPPSQEQLEKLRRVREEIIEESAKADFALHAARPPLAAPPPQRPSRSAARAAPHKSEPRGAAPQSQGASEHKAGPSGEHKGFKARHRGPKPAASPAAPPRPNPAAPPAPPASPTAPSGHAGENKAARPRRPYWRKKSGGGKPKPKAD